MINISTYDNYLLKTSSIHRKVPQIKTHDWNFFLHNFRCNSVISIYISEEEITDYIRVTEYNSAVGTKQTCLLTNTSRITILHTNVELPYM